MVKTIRMLENMMNMKTNMNMLNKTKNKNDENDQIHESGEL